MLNALYKINGLGANGAWKPYFGGGLGWTNLQVDIDDVGDFERDSSLGYQVMAGVGYEVAPQWTLLGEVRWFGTDERRRRGAGRLVHRYEVRDHRSAGGRELQLLI